MLGISGVKADLRSARRLLGRTNRKSLLFRPEQQPTYIRAVFREMPKRQVPPRDIAIRARVQVEALVVTPVPAIHPAILGLLPALDRQAMLGLRPALGRHPVGLPVQLVRRSPQLLPLPGWRPMGPTAGLQARWWLL